MFLGDADVRGLDIDSVIEIDDWDVIVYLDDSRRPPFGQCRYKPPVVTHLNVKFIDKKTRERLIGPPEYNPWYTIRGADFLL